MGTPFQEDVRRRRRPFSWPSARIPTLPAGESEVLFPESYNAWGGVD